MADKPTYEELEQRIKELEKEAFKRKQAEEALRKSEKKLRTLADFSPTALSILRGEHYLYVNSAWENLTGYSKEEARSLNPLLVVHPSMRELIRKRAADRVKGKQVPSRYEMKGVTKSGEVTWFDFSATAIEYDGEPAILTAANDITSRKQAEEEREKLINELQKALKEIKTLRGILPLCSFCKKIRDDKGYWEQVDVYIHKHSQADITHSICPDCVKEHYPDLELFDD
jgi:PAS domain S-box-containing protein